MGESWRDALSSLWQGLLYGGGSARFLRILLAVLLVASIGWSIYLYMQIVTISRIPPVEAPLLKPAAEQYYSATFLALFHLRMYAAVISTLY